MFELMDDDYKMMSKTEEISYYEDYIIEENGFTAYGLFDETDSNFSIPKTISYGVFPTSEQQVLVNDYFVKEILKTNDYEKTNGEKIVVKGEKIVISGIIVYDENRYFEIYGCNEYYKKIKDSAVFIPYNVIKQSL